MARIPCPPGPRGSAPALVLIAALGLPGALLGAAPSAGAPIPWHTYEAEAMETDGTVLGPSFEPNHVETESSGLRCVKLTEAGQHVQFTVEEPANSLVLRYSLPDADRGGGIQSFVLIAVNGKGERTVELTSRYSWIYGQYPFSNDPAQGKPRNFYDEVQVDRLSLKPGDVIRITWPKKDADHCILDLVDLEQVAPPLPRPPGSTCLLDYGVGRDGTRDATEPLRRAIAAAAVKGGTVWIPAGTYQIRGDIVVPSHVTLQGAGMWHTRFVGEAEAYSHPENRVRFKLKGSQITLSDFSLRGRLNYRNDQEPNDGVVGAGCEDSTLRNLWIEHTKVGIWIYNGARLTIDRCRFRNTLADGVNLCVGTYATLVENCSARGTGDDCFAIWPAPSDQGYADKGPKVGDNVFRHCTGQLPFLANGGAIYGGHNNRIEACAFTDVAAGCGILISTTFPTADPSLGIDNNFSGQTVVEDCALLRCGGWDHEWGPRGSFQICMDRRSISGLKIRHVTIEDSLSDGFMVVAPGPPSARGSLSQASIEASTVGWAGLNQGKHHGFYARTDASGDLTLVDSQVAGIAIDSPQFRIKAK